MVKVKVIGRLVACCVEECKEYNKTCSGIIPQWASSCQKLGYNCKKEAYILYHPEKPRDHD